MKKNFIFLLWLALAAHGFGQQSQPTSITNAQCATISATSVSTVGIQVTGTWSGTLQPEVAIQGQAAANTKVTPVGSTTAQSTITANGVYTVNVAAMSTFLVCGNTVSSGTAVVYMNGSQLSSGNSSGGGAAGGNVNGPASSTNNDIAIFGDTTGKLLADGGGPVPANTTATASNFFTAYTQSTGAFTKAQPTLAAIAAGVSPAGAFDFTAAAPFTLGSALKIPAAGMAITAVSGATTNITVGAAGTSSGGFLYTGSTSGTTGVVGCTPIGACTGFGSTSINTTFAKYSTGANCAGVGTAANPSVVTCTSASAGAFSCATAASTGTCQVNTTAVSANSEIIVTQNASEGTRLSVTCNTTSVVPAAAPLLLSKSAGASFTITLGTVTTNPGCFDYLIIN